MRPLLSLGMRTESRWLPYLIVLPALLLTAGILYPFALAGYYSLTDYNLLSPVRNFIGLRNYLDLLRSGEFWRSLGLTLLYAALVVAVEVPLGLGLALLLHLEIRSIRFFRFLFILPLMMPPVVAALMWKIILAENGILNLLLSRAGWDPVPWLANAFSLLSILLIDVWLFTPFCTVILLAGLQSLPKEPFESCQVDGASAWFTFTQLTLPMLKPFLILATLFRAIDSLKMFDLVYATTKGAHSTMLLQLNAYYESFRWYRMGRALAYMMILWLVVYLSSRLLVRSWSRSMRIAAGKPAGEA